MESKGSRWFMLLGLIALLVALGSLGIKKVAHPPQAAPASQSAPSDAPQQSEPSQPDAPQSGSSDPAARNG